MAGYVRRVCPEPAVAFHISEILVLHRLEGDGRDVVRHVPKQQRRRGGICGFLLYLRQND
jgi:hypothetical protein